MLQNSPISRHLAPLMLAAALCLGLCAPKVHARENYEITASDDIPLSIAAIATSVFGSYLYSQMEVPEQGELRQPSELFPWDRRVAGRYSETADRMSDVGALLAVAPLAIGGYAWYNGNSSGKEFATFSLMFVQSVLFQSGINLAIRSLEIWPRPYIYSESEDGKKMAEKAKGEAYGSFFSGHASAAFTVAVFTSEWYSETHPNSVNMGIVRALAFSLAGLEGVLRIAAGKHYPTDILVGALVGTGVSYGVLGLHKNRNEKISFWAGPTATGVTLKF